MACEHDENDDIGVEKAKLKNLTSRPGVRCAGTPIDLKVDSTEQHEALKLQALDEALGRVYTRTGERLDGLDVYLGAPVRCIAYMAESGGNRSYAIFLGDQMIQKTAVTISEKSSGVKGGYGAGERGVADQEYDAKRMNVLNPARLLMGKDAYQNAKIEAKAVAVIVHELGHILHERSQPASFWALKREWGESRAPANLAMEVSQYATKNKLEFTAEVFTGLVFGHVYSPAVLKQYKEYGGIQVN